MLILINLNCKNKLMENINYFKNVSKYIINDILSYVDYISFLNFGKTCKEYYTKYYFGTKRFINFINKTVGNLRAITGRINDGTYYDSEDEDYTFWDKDRCRVCDCYFYTIRDNICRSCYKACFMCNKKYIRKSTKQCYVCRKYLCIECNDKIKNLFIGYTCSCGLFACFNCVEFMRDCKKCYKKKCITSKHCIKKHGDLCSDCLNYSNI